jgi:SAM-dependent methyltransferase
VHDLGRSTGWLRSRVLTARRGRDPEPDQASPEESPDPARYDLWLASLFGDELDALDVACAEAGGEAFESFSRLGDDLWAVLLSGEYTLYPNIRALLPEMPELSLQRRWNGWTGMKLLGEGKAFYARVRELTSSHSPVVLSQSTVLDFGCGWGRMTRFFARDVRPGFLFACDPVEEILDVCQETRVPATLGRCDFVPARLPFEADFDLVFAFSVFTHLSEAAHRACLRAIHASLKPGGLLVLTVRPPAYLAHCDRMRPLLESLGPDYLTELEAPRYLFAPHPAEPGHPQFHGGEMTYGETVVTLAYVRRHWASLFDLVDVSLLTEDLHQVVLALRRRD